MIQTAKKASIPARLIAAPSTTEPGVKWNSTSLTPAGTGTAMNTPFARSTGTSAPLTLAFQPGYHRSLSTASIGPDALTFAVSPLAWSERERTSPVAPTSIRPSGTQSKWQVAVQAIGELVATYTGRIRFGIPSEFATTLLPKVLGRFSQAYPAVTLEIVSDLSEKLFSQHLQHYDLILGLQHAPSKSRACQRRPAGARWRSRISKSR